MVIVWRGDKASQSRQAATTAPLFETRDSCTSAGLTARSCEGALRRRCLLFFQLFYAEIHTAEGLDGGSEAAGTADPWQAHSPTRWLGGPVIASGDRRVALY